MAVSADVKGVKVVLKLEKGSQTISDCSKTATDEKLFEIGDAVATLQQEPVTGIVKVVESTLLNE